MFATVVTDRIVLSAPPPQRARASGWFNVVRSRLFLGPQYGVFLFFPKTFGPATPMTAKATVQAADFVKSPRVRPSVAPGRPRVGVLEPPHIPAGHLVGYARATASRRV